MKRALFLLVFVLPVVAHGQTIENLTETAKPADSFVDSIGVNVHMTYGNTTYGDIAAVEKMLVTLGVRHVRDGGKYYPSDPGYNENEFACYGRVASLGIGFDLILDFAGGTDPNPMTSAVMADLQSLATSNNVTIDSFEGPNEIDIGGDQNWIVDTQSFMQSVYSSNVDAFGNSRKPVLGPTLAGPPVDWTLLGNMTAYEDAGNIHPYANTQYPSYNFAADLANEQKVSGSQKIYVTEAGWSNAMNATDNSPNVSEDVAGRYMGRLFLETMLRGWPRTYVYELVDETADSGLTHTQDHYGLFRSDYSAKPAADHDREHDRGDVRQGLHDHGYEHPLVLIEHSFACCTPPIVRAARRFLLARAVAGSLRLAGLERAGSSDYKSRCSCYALAAGASVFDRNLPAARFHFGRRVNGHQQTVTFMVPDHPLLVKLVLVAPPTE